MSSTGWPLAGRPGAPGDPVTIARLTQAAHLLEARDAELARWLRERLVRLRYGTPAAVALGLRGPQAVRERNRLLRQAGALVGDASLWRTAGVLAAQLSRSSRARAAACQDSISRLLAAAQEAGPCPRSQRQLYGILAAEIEPNEFSAGTADNHST
jgi:hypothetical protein